MNPDDCLRQLEDLARRNPSYPDAWYNLGIFLSHLGRSPQAIEAIDKALEIHPDFAEALIARSFLLGETGRVSEALRGFRRLLARAPEDFFATYALGVFSLRHGWRSTGTAQLLRAEELRPRLPHVLFAAARALSEAGRGAEAGERRERGRRILLGLGIDPGEAWGEATEGRSAGEAWGNPCLSAVPVMAARIACTAGDGCRAVEELTEAVTRRFPGDSRLLVALGRTLRALERHPEAERWLLAAADLDRDCPEAHIELGFVRIEEDDLEGALTAFGSAVKLRPLFPDYRYHLGTLLAGMERIDEAIEELRYALLLNPSYGHASVQLASALLARNRPGEALQALEGSSVASWPEALLLAAEAEAMRGKDDTARDLLEKALALDPGYTEAADLLRKLCAAHSLQS
jgi:tetratricopeptide (TPR) repeat protein